ncbi:MAG TPA: TetR/AcrR family transcriptional regulator [Gemmatimonadales bacterium]|nr:TetR/AcrR family transcriptional regulator [Gemmatimonadales bacterium]
MTAGPRSPAAPDLPRWHRRPEARPREILDAALAAFVADGYEGATIADVARRAGVSPGLVVHYYRTKAELFAAVIEDRFLGFVAGEEALLAAHRGSSRDLLEQLVRRLWQHLWRPGTVELSLLVKAERSEFPEATQTLFQQLGERWRRLFEDVLERGAQRGEFRWSGPHAARVLGAAVVGVVESSRCFGELDQRPSSPDELWAALVDLFDHGVLARVPADVPSPQGDPS